MMLTVSEFLSELIGISNGAEPLNLKTRLAGPSSVLSGMIDIIPQDLKLGPAANSIKMLVDVPVVEILAPVKPELICMFSPIEAVDSSSSILNSTVNGVPISSTPTNSTHSGTKMLPTSSARLNTKEEED